MPQPPRSTHSEPTDPPAHSYTLTITDLAPCSGVLSQEAGESFSMFRLFQLLIVHHPSHPAQPTTPSLSWKLDSSLPATESLQKLQ